MHRLFWKSISVVAYLFSSGIGLGPICYADDAQVSLDEIERRLTEWRASFVNLRVVWELRSLPETETPVVEWSSPPDLESAKLFCRAEWIWTDDGLNLFEDRSFYWTPGAIGIRSIDVFNRPKRITFQAMYRKPPEAAEEFIQLTHNMPGRAKPSAPMEGLYWLGTAMWLPDVLDEWRWVLEGIEEVCGTPCARITTTIPQTMNTSSIETLWLDLKHDCLVRRHQRNAHDFIVDEFQQLDIGIWFPQRGRIQLQSKPVQNQLFVVTLAEVNQQLDLTRFEPPSPTDGTMVSGKLANEARAKVSQRGAAAASRDRTAKTNTTTIAGRPSWPLVMICLSVGILAIGFWFRSKSVPVKRKKREI